MVIGMAELFPLYASSLTGLRLREHEVGLALAPLAAALITASAKPSLAAYGESANIWGSNTNVSGTCQAYS